MASVAWSVILALIITSVSAKSSTPWNLAASTAPALSTANNASENAYPHCTNWDQWVTPYFQPSDCWGALELLQSTRVERSGFIKAEFLCAGCQPRTRYPLILLPEQFVFGTCTLKIFITRYYTGARIREPDDYPSTEVATYFRIYSAACAVYRDCVQAPRVPVGPRTTGYSFVGKRQGILLVMWDTNSVANRNTYTFGNSTVNASLIAPIEPLVANSSLLAMKSIVAGSSLITTATPMVSDIRPVAPVTGVRGLVDSGPTEFAPVEAA